MAAGRFSITLLDEPPRCINFQLTLPDGIDGAGIESLVGDAVVAAFGRGSFGRSVEEQPRRVLLPRHPSRGGSEDVTRIARRPRGSWPEEAARMGFERA